MPRRVANRFVIAYFALYSAGTPIIAYLLRLPDGRSVGMHDGYRVVSWVGAHVFGTGPLNADPGSGDRLFDWIQMLTFAALAAIVVAVWVLIEARRTDDRLVEREIRLDAWMRTGLRFALGGVLMYYGVEKVLPTQMPAPDLTQLLTPVGALSPERLLWTGIGASLPYESFVGVLEVAAAAMLFVPRLASLGAVLACLDIGYVFVIDAAYDIPVKLFVFHLVVIAAILVAPDVLRLANVLLNRKTVEPSRLPALFASQRHSRLATAAQILFGAYIAGAGLIQAHAAWADRDALNASMGPLYGGWTVDVMTVNGQARSPLLTDDGRWRRVVFEQGAAYFQRMDDTFVAHAASVDVDRRVVTLARERDPEWSATLAFAQPASGQLVLDGRIDGRDVHLELTWFGRESFPLVAHKFHVIRESSDPR